MQFCHIEPPLLLRQSRRHAQRPGARPNSDSQHECRQTSDRPTVHTLRLRSSRITPTNPTTAMTVIQRPLKGSRLSFFYPVKNLPSLSSLDSAFQLQEYISLLIRLDVHDVHRIVSLPGKPSDTQDTGTPLEELKNEEKDSDKDGKGDVTVDEPCWIYEQLRFACLHGFALRWAR